MSHFRVNRANFLPALCPRLCQKSNAVEFSRQRVMAGLDPAIHLSSKDSLRRVVDTRVKPAYDEIDNDGLAPE
jgi:hypothetical protein